LTPSPLFPYTTLFRSPGRRLHPDVWRVGAAVHGETDRLEPVAHDAGVLQIEIHEPADFLLAFRSVHGGRGLLDHVRHRVELGRRSEEHTSELQSPDHL